MIKLQVGIKMRYTIPGYFLLICIMIVCESVFVEEPNLLQLYKYGRMQKYKRQSECGALEFKCTSGQCVDIDAECDGLVDCGDGSDESDCSSIQCPYNSFRCTYGACINKDLKCNGKPDCRDNSDEEISICETRVTSKTTTRIDQFKCSSGEYINAGFVCNGKKDCIDASDETIQECEVLACAPKLFFRCDYGACLDKSLQCNGVDDCLDGSDETNCPNIQLSLILKSVCLIPDNPPYGEHQLNVANLKPGDYAQKYSVIETTCAPGYKPNHAIKQLKYSVCLNGQWLPELPPCEKTCSSISSSTSITVVCKRKGVLLEDCTAPLDGTIATLKCQQSYESSEIAVNPTRVCRNGNWDYPIPECVRSSYCGGKRESESADPLESALRNERIYPWHVGIYLSDNDAYICGGSIISSSIVVSVAHCFTDFDQSLRSHENYKVAAGKYYRIYNDLRDRHAQYSLIKEIKVPRSFKGYVQNYQADIAVLVLKTPLNMSVSVQPICVDWTNEFEHLQLTQNNVGVAVGWGFASTGGTPSDKLKEMHIAFKPYEECYANTSSEARKFLTLDKICGAGRENNFICTGDSGSALAFQLKKDRYYIRGISSVTPSRTATGEANCGPKETTFFTLLSQYIEFLTETTSLHKL